MKRLKTFEAFINEKRTLQDFLKDFPLNAKTWNDATDEIVSLADHIEDELEIDSTNIGRSKTPSEWNKKHRKRVLNGWKKLSDKQKKSVADHFGWFTHK